MDSPVDGLTYKTPSLSGTTDARGGFKYRSGEDVAFYIGDLKLGSAKGADILTPIQLVPGARNADNATVANICVLLQSLDEDGDLNNGIRINKATTDIVSKYADRIRFDQSIARFVSDDHVAALVAELNAAKVFKSAAAVPRVLQTPQSAKNHLLATLRPRKIVTTTSGAVSGFAASDDIWAWFGIPYAKTRRWQAPRNYDKWSGVREATAHCSECTQQVSGRFWWPEDKFKGGDDCLNLEIYRPRTDAKNLPVFFWIHGGSNKSGNAAETYGGALAREGNMVVVVVQYRLAALGWFSHPAFREGQDAANASGNYGTLDHIQALKWVRKNIAAFGGDSRKVTIGGQSAGGHNVMNLMISPQAKGLFSGVVAVSPAVESMMPLRSFKETDAAADKIIDWLLVKDGKAADAEAAKAYRVSMSNADIRAYLLGQPAEAILRAARDGVGQGSMPSYPAHRDGTVLPDASWTEAIAAGKYNKVPLMIGTTESEFFNFLPFWGPAARAAFRAPSGKYGWENVYRILDGKLTMDQVFPTETDKNLYYTIGNLKSRLWKLHGTDAVARALKAQDPKNAVYAYLFQWAGGGDPELEHFKFIFGAAHAFDLPFFFAYDNDIFGYSFTEANKKGREALSKAMMTYLCSFIQSGNPNTRGGSGVVRWPHWSNEKDGPKAIHFDADLNEARIEVSKTEETPEGVSRDITAARATYAKYIGVFNMFDFTVYDKSVLPPK